MRSELFAALVLLLKVFILSSANNSLNFKIVFENWIGKYPNPKYVEGNITVRKYNRTTLVANAYWRQHVTFNVGDCKINVRCYQLMSNQYRPTSMNFELDFCTAIASNSFGAETFMQNSNFSDKCPMEPGLYVTHNNVMNLDLPSIFPNIPSNFMGKWKASLVYTYHKNLIAIEDLYIAIVKK